MKCCVIVEHNRMAAKVMAEMNVPVNDFYGLLVNKRELARGDRFHWTAPVYDLLAKAVAKSVLRELEKMKATARTKQRKQVQIGKPRLARTSRRTDLQPASARRAWLLLAEWPG